MFERFTDRARRVVVLAQEEARMLNHNYIGTEHILLGLIHEGEGVAAKALESMNISLDAVREQVQEIIGQGQAARPVTSRSRLEPRRSWSCRCAKRCSSVTTTSVPSTSCSGLIREGEGVAAQVLQKLGADLNRVRQTVIQLLSGYTGGKGEQVAAGGTPRRRRAAPRCSTSSVEISPSSRASPSSTRSSGARRRSSA
jgi:ATP-dependent Clp protease ATP-binding subunit ClpC